MNTFDRMCGTIDPELYIRRVLDFSIKTRYNNEAASDTSRRCFPTLDKISDPGEMFCQMMVQATEGKATTSRPRMLFQHNKQFSFLLDGSPFLIALS
jgi:hypothetical protein